MKIAATAVPVVALLTVLAVGCSTKKPTPQASALDVGPTSPNGNVALSSTPYSPPAGSGASTYTPPVTYTPPSPPSGPVFSEAAVGAPEAPVKTAGGNSYTIQKGDTLTKIARQHYGDPGKWKQIAAANPGMNPNSIRAGQKIVLP